MAGSLCYKTFMNKFVIFQEIYDVWTAWQFGVSLTVAAPLCCRTVCYLCGSAGKHEVIKHHRRHTFLMHMSHHENREIHFSCI
jgi:hypothetical protein